MTEYVPDEQVITALYSPEQAGKQIGWVATEAKDNVGQHGVDIVEVNIGVASVSDKGAQRGHTLRTEEGQKRQVTFLGDVTGFVAASRLRLEIIRGMSVEEAVEKRGIDLAAGMHDRDASGMVSDASKLENVTWVEDPKAILAELKKRLSDEDIKDYYKVIYYGLNIAIGHIGVRKFFRNYVSTDERPTFVADPVMQETTTAQLDASEVIVDELLTIQAEDGRMMDRLTVFSDIPASRILDVFRDSRHAVHKAEARAFAQASSALLLPRYVYIPNRSGRLALNTEEVPEEDYERAFRAELEALQRKNARPVARGLEERIKETENRLQYAQLAVLMLSGLLASEKLAA